MTGKEATKMKEDFKADIAKLREETKAEIKLFRESMEREMRNELRELKSEKQGLVKSLEFAHDSIKELEETLNTEIAKNKNLAAENETLRSMHISLESKVLDLDKRLIQSEQYSRRANLEIQGVVKNDSESVTDIVSKIGDAISEPIQECDIEACHRVPTRKADKANIVVQFRSRAKRDTVLQKAKKMRLKNTDVGLENSDPVYVNEHLCPAQKKLLAFAVKKKYEHQWKSVWSQNGKIFMKQSDSSVVVPITSDKDLIKLFSSESNRAESATGENHSSPSG